MFLCQFGQLGFTSAGLRNLPERSRGHPGIHLSTCPMIPHLFTYTYVYIYIYILQVLQWSGNCFPNLKGPLHHDPLTEPHHAWFSWTSPKTSTTIRFHQHSGDVIIPVPSGFHPFPRLSLLVSAIEHIDQAAIQIGESRLLLKFLLWITHFHSLLRQICCGKDWAFLLKSWWSSNFTQSPSFPSVSTSISSFP